MNARHSTSARRATPPPTSSPSRRDFLVAAGAAGAGLALGPDRAAPAPAAPAPAAPAHPRSQAPKRFLILGGTGFIGPHTVRYAVERGHEVAIFTRGRADADLPDGVERLVGDRNGDHSALEGRTWDVVLDNNCQNYRWAQLSTELLKDAAEHYIFVSSISAYAIQGMGFANKDRVLWEPAVPEDYPRFEPPEGWQDGDDAHYGLMKRLSEDIAHAAFPGRTTVIRPGLIVGPTDPTDRFTYWPVRIAQGGEVLAPGNPDHSIQIIDQRDLTEWTVRVAEEGDHGRLQRHRSRQPALDGRSPVRHPGGHNPARPVHVGAVGLSRSQRHDPLARPARVGAGRRAAARRREQGGGRRPDLPSAGDDHKGHPGLAQHPPRVPLGAAPRRHDPREGAGGAGRVARNVKTTLQDVMPSLHCAPGATANARQD